jgi:hypothetical protein
VGLGFVVAIKSRRRKENQNKHMIMRTKNQKASRAFSLRVLSAAVCVFFWNLEARESEKKATRALQLYIAIAKRYLIHGSNN